MQEKKEGEKGSGNYPLKKRTGKEKLEGEVKSLFN